MLRLVRSDDTLGNDGLAVADTSVPVLDPVPPRFAGRAPVAPRGGAVGTPALAAHPFRDASLFCGAAHHACIAHTPGRSSSVRSSFLANRGKHSVALSSDTAGTAAPLEASSYRPSYPFIFPSLSTSCLSLVSFLSTSIYDISSK